MRRTRVLIATLCVGVGAATTIAVVRSGGIGEAGQDAESDQASSGTFDLASVEQRDLIRAETFDASVGHGERSDLRLAGNGVVTGLPAVGAVVQFGEGIVEIDGEPVALLHGDRPAWRELGSGVTGVDVAQLESALVEMGYADPAKVTVDETWTSATTAAVKAMQKLMGMPADGRLDLGEVVFSPTPVRIASIDGGLGDEAGAIGIKTSELDQSIALTLSASKADLASIGDSVDIELPSGETVVGTVEAIGSPESGDDGTTTVTVTITATELDLADGTEVEVTLEAVAVEDATAVPAAALLALVEGGYAVEVPDASAATGTRLVAVDIGEFADGWVQISGEIAAGDQVVVP